jgi:class 3 adenylate cyclase
MLAAIGELAGATPAPPEPTTTTEPKTQDTAERRQVTVMFSDLVGSTALSTRMDPEDLREVISAYQNCVAETVRRFNGFVAKYMGDGVLVCLLLRRDAAIFVERTEKCVHEATVSRLGSSSLVSLRAGIARI